MAIEFVDANPQELLDSCIAIVEKTLGRTLARADPIRLLLDGLCAILIQQRILIDESAKMNLLAYAKGEYLEALGEFYGVKRLKATAATTTLELELSSPRTQVTTIPKGTRFTADSSCYFALDRDVVFESGEIKKSAKAICTSLGLIGNDFEVGEIKRIVDPRPFLTSGINVTKSEGGSDEESDESLRERIRQAPESFSVAGSEGAYIFHAKSVNPLIADVSVDSSEPGKVEVYVLLQGGNIPDVEMLNAVYEKLSDKTVRPLTDFVSVLAPNIVHYNIDIQYFISRDDGALAAQIVQNAEKAIGDFVDWQKEKIGRDINPSELIHRLMQAGVKRVEITEPLFTVLDKHSVAIAEDISATFGGLEDN